MAADLYRVGLPSPWNYAATSDGRVFFINEETRTTSWLHPVTGDPVQTGNTLSSDLPRGWEKTLTQDGILYYIDHVNLRTSFQHPITGETSAIAMTKESPVSSTNESSVSPPLEPAAKQRKARSNVSMRRKSSSSRSSGRRKVVNNPPEAKRSTESPVSMKGWLYKQESGGLKSWKRRWFVLSDFCIFYYRGPEEDHSLGSILLPSYKVNPCISKDGISKKFAFKAEHANMRTYIFAAESKEEMSKWMNAMSLATILQKDPSTEQEYGDRPRHHRRDDDGGFRSQPRPVNLPLHGRAPYADDWGSAPSSDNSEHVQTSPRGQAGQGSYPRQWQQQQQQQQPCWQQSEPMNKRHIPDPAYKHNSDIQRRPGKDPATDPHYGCGPSSPDNSKPDPQHPDQSSTYRASHPGPAYQDGRQPVQRPDRRYFPDPRSDQQNTQRRRDEALPVQRSMPGSGYQDRNGRFMRNSPRSSVGHSGSTQQQTPRPAVDGPGSPRMQPDDRTPRREMSDNRKGRGPDVAYPGYAKPPQDIGQRQAPPSAQNDWLSQNVDPAGRRQNRNFAQPEAQHPGHPSASLPNHYGRATNPAGAKHNTFDPRDRRYDHKPPGGSTRLPDVQTSQLRTNRSPTSDGSSSYSSRSNQGRSKEPAKKSLFSDQPPGGSTHQSPRNQQQLSSHDDPRRYFEPLTIQTGPIYENLNQMPPQITVSDVTPTETPTLSQREGPIRPPLPAALRDDYIRELAKSRSPHTREDMLNASHIASRRQNEPLIFRYPNTSQGAKYLSSNPPAIHPKPAVPQQKRSPPMVPPHGKTQQYGGDRENYPESYWTAKRNLERKSATQGPDYHSPGAQSGGRTSPQVGPGTHLHPVTGHNISTIPEDPDMVTSDLLTTKNLMSLQQKLANQGLRLSICASDLIGKSHEELVLLLIQLRRSQARLRDAKSYCRSRLDDSRDNEKGYQFRQSNSFGGLEDGEEEEHDKFLQLRKQKEQLQKQMEVHKPLVNLVDNMVTMGSLYGGDNLMMASQYKKHRLRPDQVTPAKPMIEFSRKHQEDKLAHEQQEELRELTEDEVNLEEKLQQLYESDRELQEKSFMVQSLQEDKELLEKALEAIVDQEREQRDPRELQNLALQRKNIESELLRVRQQLADSSKQLEEVAANNARVEHEVVLLRSRIHGLDKSCTSPSLSHETVKARKKLERELTSIQTVISGLSQQRQKLSETMQSLRHSTPDLSTATDKPTAVKSSSKPYMETDVDTMESRDISVRDETDQGDRQSTLPADSAGLRRATAVDNISSATYNSPLTVPDVELGRQNAPRTLRESDGMLEVERRHVPRTYRDANGMPEVERRHVPRTYRDDNGTPEVEHHHVPRTYRDDNGTPEVERHHVPRTYRDDNGTPEVDRHNVPRTYRDDNGTPEVERPHVPRTYRDDNGTPEVERHHVPRTYRDDNGTPELEHHHVPRTYRDDNGTPELEHHHVPRTYRDDNGTPEVERHHVPRTYRDNNGTPEVERHHVPRTYRDDNGTPEVERRHVPRTYRDDNGTPEVERHHVPRTYDGGHPPVSSGGNYAPEMEHRHVPRTYNRTASPFGGDSKSVRPNSTSDQQYEPRPYMNGDAETPTDQDPYHPVPDDTAGSSRWQQPQASDWRNPLYEPMRRVEDLSPDTPTEYTDSYPPRDSSDFDENTKRFYGLLPREKSRGQTVRKVKKNESERRGRDRWRSPIGGSDENPAPVSQRSKSLPRRTPSQTTKGPEVRQKSFDDSMTRLSSNGDKSGLRQSAAARLFPSGIPPSYASSNQTVNSKESVRRISDLFTPRPFGVHSTSGVRSVSLSASRVESEEEAIPTDDSVYGSGAVTTMHINPVTWKPSQPVSCTITTATVKPMTASSVPSENQPNVKRGSASGLTPREKLRMRRTSGSRFQTISSSEPVKMERSPMKAVNIHTTAGDLISSRHDTNLPELVRADIINPEEFDVETIDRLVLGIPEKVEIPDRYMPESDDELTQEEKLFHEEKAQRLKKLLAAQSLQEWSKEELNLKWSREELGGASQGLHNKVEAEKVRREHMLDIRQVLAREVMQKSREVAATRLRQSSATAGEGDVIESDPEVESPTNDLYHQMTSHKMAAIPLDQRQSFYT